MCQQSPASPSPSGRFLPWRLSPSAPPLYWHPNNARCDSKRKQEISSTRYKQDDERSLLRSLDSTLLYYILQTSSQANFLRDHLFLLRLKEVKSARKLAFALENKKTILQLLYMGCHLCRGTPVSASFGSQFPTLDHVLHLLFSHGHDKLENFLKRIFPRSELFWSYTIASCFRLVLSLYSSSSC